MKFEEVMRGSARVRPSDAAKARWHRAIFNEVFGAAAPKEVTSKGWWPSVASGLAMTSMMLLLWPAAARGPVLLRSGLESCDGRWERAMPVRVDVRGFARPVPAVVAFAAADQCSLCHLPR